MTLKNKFFIGAALLSCLVLGFAFGFNAGWKRKLESTQPMINYRIDPEKSAVIEKRYFYFTGQVSEIDSPNNAITLSAGGESVKVEIKENTPVISYAFREDDKTPNDQPKTVALKDVLVGDKVSVYAEEQKNGKPLGINVYIHFTPVRAF